MEIYKLTTISSVVMEMFGEMPLDPLHEVECDIPQLLSAIYRAQVKIFKEEEVRACFTRGLPVSPYFNDYAPAYWGQYLN